MDRAIAQAPATIANVCVGFDILGFAVPILKDTVIVSKASEGVVIKKVVGMNLPTEARENTAGRGLQKMIEVLDLPFGFEVEVKKGIPLGSGLGGSAASAVASVVAANALLDRPLPKDELFQFALVGESAATGGVVHGDNVAAALLGGLTMCLRPKSEDKDLTAFSLPIPDIHCVIVHPDQVIETKEARKILAEQIPLKDHVNQSMRLAAFMMAIFTEDLTLLGNFFEDIVIEPQRASLIPSFYKLKEVAVRNGALGFSIAGAGPTMFGWYRTSEQAQKTRQLFENMGFQSWTCQIDRQGATVIHSE
ncbi:MAG: homoserine kinase [Methanobacteriota archaeon]|nr:MAG: homoserine kinase [Euryarchaeota archaeon]